MTKIIRKLIVIISVLIIISNNTLIYVHSSNTSTYIFDDREARAFISFMYNTNMAITEKDDLSENDVYKLLTGQYERNSQEEYIAKISFLSTLYELINTSISDQTNTMNATRAHLLEYLEKQVPDNYSEYVIDSIIDKVVKSAWKGILYDICKWDIDLVNDIELISNSIKTLTSIPAKANKYVERAHAAIVAGIDVVSSNKLNMYLYFREYVNAYVSMGEYADIYMSAFDLSLSGRILAYDPILNWHSEGNLQTLKRWAKYVSDIELSLNTSDSKPTSFYCKFSLNYPFANDIICYTAQDTVNFLGSSQAQPTRDGYKFDWWYLDAACTTPWTNGEIEKGQTFYAKWEKNTPTTYRVTFISNCPNVSGYSYTFNSGTSIQLKNYEMYREHYIFDGWYYDSSYTNPVSDTLTITNDHTLYAKWKYQYEYTISNNEATITKFVGYAKKNNNYVTDIAIPESINGYVVRHIGQKAFYSSQLLTSVKLPNTILTIDDDAFHFCRALKIINVPEGVTKIGKMAFRYCDENLTNIHVPESVDFIGDRAFHHCDKLNNISVAENNKNYSSQNGILFDKSKQTLIHYPRTKSEISYSIPTTVTTIANSAFECNDTLTKITIPDSVETIGSCAFERCIKIKSFKLGSGVKKINSRAFWSCDNLTNIELGENIDYIGSQAFTWCINLKNIVIPDSVKEIGSHAFSLCKSMQTVSIGSGVTKIGDSAFDSCYALTEFTVKEKNQYYCSEDGVLFDKFKQKLIYYPASNIRQLYTIPNTVNTVKDSAFSDCSYLQSVIIPNTVTTLGSYAFAGCKNLTNINFGKGLTYIPDGAFASCDSLKYVEIPDNIVELRYGSFRNCPNLKTIKIPVSIKSIGSSVFYEFYTGSLSDIYYSGTKEQWEQVSIGSSNYDLDDATIHYNSRKITFDANNGITSTLSKYVTYNIKYGTLPIPTRTGYNFIGWYTEPVGGTQITSDTNVTAEADHTLYAQWEKLEPYTRSTVTGYDNTYDAHTNEKFVYVVDTELYDSTDDCTIIVAGYNNGKMETFTTQPSTQENRSFRLTSDVAVDEIKVMLWNDTSLIKPLCKIESITNWLMHSLIIAPPLY